MKNALMLFLCIGMLAAGATAQDPGIADTVKLVGDSLIVGQSRPVEIVVFNDEVVDTARYTTSSQIA